LYTTRQLEERMAQLGLTENGQTDRGVGPPADANFIFFNLKVGVGIAVIGVLCFFCGVFLMPLDFVGGTASRKRWGDDE